MKQVLVLGGEGMLGHKMFQTLNRLFVTTCTIRGSVHDYVLAQADLCSSNQVIDHFDAMDFPLVEQVLQSLQPSIVVNCIGMIKQRPEAKSALPVILLNAALPHKLADICSVWGGKVIHFSTDCVFSGQRGRYMEDDPSDAEDLYGKSKYLGEVTGGNSLTLRTSIIGRELSCYLSLLEWLLSQVGKTVKGFTRVFYSGVTTNYLAQLVGRIICDHPELSGLYQVTSPPISKYDLLHLLRKAYDLDIEIIPDDDVFCDRSMCGDKFIAATGYACPTWPELVAQIADDPTPYDAWR